MFGHDDNKDNKDQDDHAAPVALDEPLIQPGSTEEPAGAAAHSPSAGAPTLHHDNKSPDDKPSDRPAMDLPSVSGEVNELLSLKQQALQALTPLVDHLDQSPEEKFRTTMMMIQAADNQSLLKDAYEAAKQISNEKERAQALLDIVNEINYFTQQQNDKA
jgi:hypothetical protein